MFYEKNVTRYKTLKHGNISYEKHIFPFLLRYQLFEYDNCSSRFCKHRFYNIMFLLLTELLGKQVKLRKITFYSYEIFIQFIYHLY